MPIEKTSRSRFFTARINPATSAAEARAIEIIDHYTAQGVSFKQLVVDRIVQHEGEAVLFAKPTAGTLTITQMQALLSEFSTQLIARIGERGTLADGDDSAADAQTETLNSFQSAFLGGFLKRQGSLTGDE